MLFRKYEKQFINNSFHTLLSTPLEPSPPPSPSGSSNQLGFLSNILSTKPLSVMQALKMFLYLSLCRSLPIFSLSPSTVACLCLSLFLVSLPLCPFKLIYFFLNLRLKKLYTLKPKHQKVTILHSLPLFSPLVPMLFLFFFTLTHCLSHFFHTLNFSSSFSPIITPTFQPPIHPTLLAHSPSLRPTISLS